MVLSDADQIRNLIYRYAELIDDGDFASVAELFESATVDWGGDVTAGSAPVRERLEATTRRYDDGTPRTSHVITNVQVHTGRLDGDAAYRPSGPDEIISMSARSRFTVFQATDRLSLQPIITGRYHDEFEQHDGLWRFSYRSYRVDLMGDLSAHLPADLIRHLS